MNIWQKKKKEFKKNVETKNNRINVIIAIVFLFGAATIYKIFNLQVLNFDYYSELASSQHLISSALKPSRGNIYLGDYKKDKKKPELYLFASNKDFADLYAVPQDVINSEDLAEKLFIVFKQDGIKNEVENILESDWRDKQAGEIAIAKKTIADQAEQDAKISEIIKRYEELLKDSNYLEYRQIRQEKEFNLRKEAEIKKYLDKLNKQNDPYEPLEKKVDDDTLKKLYSLALSNNSKEVLPADLEVKGGKIIFNQSNLNNSAKSDEAKIPGIGFNMSNYRYYPEKNIGAHLLGFARENNGEIRGNYGLEGFFDSELFGEYGYIKSERSADKNAIILNDREFTKSIPGADLVLTIDRSVQYIVCEKLKKAVEKNAADGGSVIVMNPWTGEIIAMCAYPDFDPNRFDEIKDIKYFNNPTIFSQYEPGSIFKAITMAMGLDQEKVTPESTYNDTGVFKIANYEIKNSDKKAHGVVNMTQVLENSLNTGVIHVMQQIGQEKFVEYIKNFGFGEKTGIELEGESKGDIKNLVNSKGEVEKELYAATASFGQGISVTPIQMVTAFSALANGGVLVKPYVVKEIIKPNGEKITTNPTQIKRLISERASALLSGMLVEVVENGHGKKAGVKGYYVAGKTGTAQVAKANGRGYEANANIGSFAGYAPASNPVFAMLVRMDRPRNVVWAESSAAPLFGEIADYLLSYYQVPKERDVGK